MAEKSETLVTKEERVNEAKELFGRGSRNYCVKQYADAADDLSACCSIYSELYGPNAEQLGLPYLMYAKSLIALGKDENNLIVAGDEEEDGEDDDDEEEEDGEEGDGEGGDEKEQDEEEAEKEKPDEPMDTKEQPAEGSASAEKENGKNAEPDSSSSSKVDKEAAGSSSSSKDATNGEPQPGPSTSNGDATTAAQEEAADNLQVAWEILELAVHIFQQQGEKGYENLPECYTELAGISFENSFFKEAIKDYGKALEIYTKTEQPDRRLLAEVNYKVGLCHMMEREFKESIAAFKGAIRELEKVVEEEKAKEQTDEVKETIEDFEQMKKEILEKIMDVEDAMKTPMEEVKRELSKIIVSSGGESSGKELNNGAGPSGSGAGPAASTNGSGSKPSTATAKPATDISHLIKRKKPDSVTTEVEGSPAKKTATDTEAPATHDTSA
uniref:Tetratricopeptide SHNi-TPR domain-containing protein n=1 Tax=Anopheles dirus TaxID=7168 RepID=A0A182N7B0_9DIPT